jgi:excisionase family DNA binding protein
MREIMTPEQVADYLQLNTDTVYRLIRSHKLAASKIGRTYRIPKEDVDSFLMAHSSRPKVREALFRRVMEFAERNNPDLSSDQVLEELEAMDEEEKRARAKRG